MVHRDDLRVVHSDLLARAVMAIDGRLDANQQLLYLFASGYQVSAACWAWARSSPHCGLKALAFAGAIPVVGGQKWLPPRWA